MSSKPKQPEPEKPKLKPDDEKKEIGTPQGMGNLDLTVN